MKEVFLHIGMHKTGTTYLQGLLSYNEKLLKKFGIDYPSPDNKKTIELGMSVGNLVRLAYQYNEIKSKKGTAIIKLTTRLSNKISEVAYNSKFEKIIFSGEFLWIQKKDQIHYLLNKLSKFSKVTIICFTRDIFDLQLSMWKQHIKAGRTLNNFYQYVEKYNSNEFCENGFYRDFYEWNSGKTNFVLLNYDTFKKNLSNSFFKTIDPNVSDKILIPDINTPNSSPSYSQIEYLRTLNLPYINHLKHKILLEIKHEKEKFYDKEFHKKMISKNINSIKKINKIIVGNKIKTSLRKEDYLPQYAKKEMVDEVNKFNENYIKNKNKMRIIDYIINLIFYIKNKSFPLDFNPNLYKLINVDVLKSGVNPRIHYLINGINEYRQFK